MPGLFDLYLRRLAEVTRDPFKDVDRKWTPTYNVKSDLSGFVDNSSRYDSGQPADPWANTVVGAGDPKKAIKTVGAPKPTNDPDAPWQQQVGSAVNPAVGPEGLKPPPPPPDLTDEAVRKARKLQAMLLLGTKGRKASFLTGPTGLTGPMDLSRQVLLGK